MLVISSKIPKIAVVIFYLKEMKWRLLEKKDRKSEFNPDQIKFWLLPDKIKEEGLESIHAELGKKRSELTKIGFQKADKEQKLNDILGKIKALETGRIDHLRDQLKFLGDKLTNPSDANIISHQETIAIRTLIYFLTDLEKEGKLETPLTDTEKGYLTNTKVEQLEAIATRNASLPKYKNYSDKKLFKKDELKLKEIANILLNLEDKSTFFTELKEYLKDKKGLPDFPADTTDDYEKQDYFFTLNPEHVIKFSATYQIKHDGLLKEQTKQAMEK
ncbi:4304_t:CDS:2, partial [Paraglomus occultum]